MLANFLTTTGKYTNRMNNFVGQPILKDEISLALKI